MGRETARNLRKNPTDTERFVWQHIRYRQLDGNRFRRQHPLGPYVVDFVCLEKRLILELDGGQHAEQVKDDLTRTCWLERQGFRVIRFWNNEALENWDGVEQVILEQLQGVRSNTPHPNPPPQGGREQE